MTKSKKKDFVHKPISNTEMHGSSRPKGKFETYPNGDPMTKADRRYFDEHKKRPKKSLGGPV